MKYYRLKIHTSRNHNNKFLKDLNKFLKNQGLPSVFIFNALGLSSILTDHQASVARIQFGNEISLTEYSDEN